MRVIDCAGNRYSRLLVLTRDGSSKSGQAQWRCLCDCGAQLIVQGRDLRSGNTSSCGCSGGRKPKDLVGMTFGRLTVLSLVSSAPRRWRVACACGRECDVLAGNLASGHTRSCGCLKDDQTLPKLLAATAARTHPTEESRAAARRASTLKWRAKAVKELHSNYVRRVLGQAGVHEPTPDLIDLKREQLSLRRLAKLMKQAATQAMKEEHEAIDQSR